MSPLVQAATMLSIVEQFHNHLINESSVYQMTRVRVETNGQVHIPSIVFQKR
jgi:hypothetical protein